MFLFFFVIILLLYCALVIQPFDYNIVNKIELRCCEQFHDSDHSDVHAALPFLDS